MFFLEAFSLKLYIRLGFPLTAEEDHGGKYYLGDIRAAERYMNAVYLHILREDGKENVGVYSVGTKILIGKCKQKCSITSKKRKKTRDWQTPISRLNLYILFIVPQINDSR